MAEPATATNGQEAVTGGAFGIKGLAWAIFEGARNPYYNLIVIYIFAPYYADVIVGGSELGLTLSGLTITIAGIITALTAPFLGVIADQAGQRKPPIAFFIAALVLCSAALWWSTPDGPFGVWSTMAILAAAYCCYGYSEVLHNAMLPIAGRPSALPYISGLGLAMGNVLSVGIILFFLIGLMLPGQLNLPFIPTEPVLDLDQTTHEPQRFAGPFVAVWMALLMIPFFVFMPDASATGKRWKSAAADLFRGQDRATNPQSIGQRFQTLSAYLKRLFREQPRVMRFLIARTIYADAMAALLTLGAVYARTFLGWSAIEILIFGIAGLVFGAVGGFVGGVLDRWLGPKLALIVELIALITILFIQLTISPDALFFGLIPASEPVWNSPFFTSLADVVYFAMVIPLAVAVVACISSSRYMLVHISPPERIGEFFGLYAIAGTVTVWMGPGIVSLLTWLTQNQRIGMSGIGFMFLIGLIILWNVDADKVPEFEKTGETGSPASPAS